MKLADEDIQLFKDLQGSSIGKHLVAYLEKLNVWLCDCRHWKAFEKEDIKAMVNASTAIEEHIIKRIKLQNKKKESNLNQFE